MIGHQAVRPYVNTVPEACFFQQGYIGEVIIVAEKHIHAAVAPLDNMMGVSGCYHSCYARHTTSLLFLSAKVKLY
jgi:hypothetical protein